MRRPGIQSDFLLRGLLVPFATVYGVAIEARNAYYDRVRSASRAAGVPVVSIGNLTVGGTGKTPLTIEIVRRLRAAGRRPAILTRGYGARSHGAADEVREFSLAVPEVPVVVDPDRVGGAAAASREYAADCLVLDDGFQHRRLRRDLDVVLIDALDPWGGGWVLPAGRLREPLSSLRRADWIVITRSNQVEPETIREITATLQDHAPDAPVVKAAVAAEGLIGADGHTEPPAILAERSVLPVCGIGNPTSFLRLVESLGGTVVEPMIFGDHHRYRPADAAAIVDAARRRGADWVVTTRKDWVKLSGLWPPSAGPGRGVPLFRLDTRAALADPRGAFDARLRGLFEERT